MKLTSNLSKPWRVIYVLIGVGLVITPLVWKASTGNTILAMCAGALAILTGTAGF